MSKPFSFTDLFLRMIEENMKNVKHKVIVLSGKGGVGKSFIAVNLSLALSEMGLKIGLFDADLHGSSVPILLGVKKGFLYLEESRIIPVEGPLNVKFVSISLMTNSYETPIVWRGPLKTRAILEILARTYWGDIDYLIIDTPPGTGDEILTITQSLKKLDGGIVITAPNILTESIVTRTLNFLHEAGIRVLALVENFSYFKCPDTGKEHYPFGESNIEKLASKYKVDLVIKLPIDPLVAESIKREEPYYISFRNSEVSSKIRELASEIIKTIESVELNRE
ncbi:MAG: Mrp/NBP35 family ATP-binding protein [Desulfurococcaceae archaeon]|uniref:Iron-sulfur cluster carrier protein n=1 Tax=Staphylothermus marinus TaxID=2280 RepID=A0A7C4HE90_STAMA